MQRSRRSASRGLRAAVVVLTILAGNAVVASDAIAAHATIQTQDVSVTSTTAVLAAPVVGLAATPSGKGYWRAAADGGVLTAGDAQFYGSAAGKFHDTIVAIVRTRSGHGYWLTDRSGGVFNFGDGNGYWLVASDGGIFSFNAPFLGSTGSMRLNRPIVGMAPAPKGHGYWLVASDGGIFAFHAPFRGSTGSIPLNQPVVGMAAAPGGDGYTMIAADGGLFRFGSNSPFYGSAVGACPGAPAVAVAMSPAARGYWIAFADGRTYAFSRASTAPKCSLPFSSKAGYMAADLFSRVNAERSARGLAPLVWDGSLASYATSWSADMAAHGFRHSSISNLLGPYDYVGENIAAGSAGTLEGSLHNAWMHSDGHRANILAPGFTHVGIGAYCAPDGGLWLTEDFGRTSSEGAAPISGSTPPVDPIARPDSGSLHC